MHRLASIGFLLLLASVATAADRVLLIRVPLGFPRSQKPSPDLAMMRELLENVHGFPSSSITELAKCRAAAEGGSHEACPCSRSTILNAIENLSIKSGPKDRVVIYWSGHGTRRATERPKPEEPDQCDEVLITCDFEGTGCEGGILDDDLAVQLEKLRDRRLVVIIDACFSGGATKQIGGNWVEVQNQAPDVSLAKSVPNCCSRLHAGLWHQPPQPAFVALLSSTKWQVSRCGPSEMGYVSYFTEAIYRAHYDPTADANRDDVISFAEAMAFARKMLRGSQDPVFLGPDDHAGLPFLYTPKPSLLASVKEVRGGRVVINRGSDQFLGQFARFEVVREGTALPDLSVLLDKDDISEQEAIGQVEGKGDVKAGDRLRASEVALHLPNMKVAPTDRGDVVTLMAIRSVVEEVPGITLAAAGASAEVFVRLVPKGGGFSVQLITSTGFITNKVETDTWESAQSSLAKLIRAQLLIRGLNRIASAPMNQREAIALRVVGGNRPFLAKDGFASENAIRFEIEADQDREVTLLSIGPSGDISTDMLRAPLRVRAGERCLVPPLAEEPLYVQLPAGLNQVFAIATPRRVSIDKIVQLLTVREDVPELAKDLFLNLSREPSWTLADVVVESYERKP